MKICAFSDTHGNLDFKIPDGMDLVLCAGDICPTEWCGSDEQLIKQGRFLAHKFYPWVVNAQYDEESFCLTPGNHDLIFQKEPWMVPDPIKSMSFIDQLHHYHYNFGEPFLKMWFSPWTVPFGQGWAYNLRNDLRKQKFEEIPSDTDILVCHQPPYGLGDFTDQGEHVGCPFLRERIEEIKPKLVFCGHIHPAARDEQYIADNGVTKVYNVAMCDDHHKLVRQPLVVEI